MNNDNYSLDGKSILLIHIIEKYAYSLRHMKKLGLRIVVLHSQKEHWAEEYVDDWIIPSTDMSSAEILELIRKYLQKDTSIAGAITFWEEEVPLAAEICNEFHWIGNSIEAALNTRSKFQMHEVLREGHRPSIPQRLIIQESDFHTAMEEIGFPSIMKPIFGSDSLFVVYITNAQEAKNAYEYIRTHCEFPDEMFYKYDKNALVYQKFIEGPEFSIECYCQDGTPHVVAIHEKAGMQLPFFVESGGYCPPRISPFEQEQLSNEAKASLCVLGVTNSLAHVEMKLTANGPQIIEVGSRLGSGDIFKNVCEVYAFDLIKAACQIALGIPVTQTPSSKPKKFIRTTVFIPEKSGIVTSMTGFDSLKNNPNVNELSLYKKVGDVVKVPPDGFERIGWVSVKGNDANDAEQNLQKVCSNISYEIAPM